MSWVFRGTNDVSLENDFWLPKPAQSAQTVENSHSFFNVSYTNLCSRSNKDRAAITFFQNSVTKREQAHYITMICFSVCICILYCVHKFWKPKGSLITHLKNLFSWTKDWCTLIRTTHSSKTLLHLVWINVHQYLVLVKIGSPLFSTLLDEKSWKT